MNVQLITINSIKQNNETMDNYKENQKIISPRSKIYVKKIKYNYMNKEELEEKKENCNDSEYKEDKDSDPDMED